MPTTTHPAPDDSPHHEVPADILAADRALAKVAAGEPTVPLAEVARELDIPTD